MDTDDNLFATNLLPDRLLPSPCVALARASVGLTCLTTVAALVWSAWTPLDEVVIARGKIEVRGEPIAVTAAEAGLVTKVCVQVGATVRQGELLLQLDSFQYVSEQQSLAAQVHTYEIARQRYLASAEGAADILQVVQQQLAAAEQAQKLRREQQDRLGKLVNAKAASIAELQLAEQEYQVSQSELHELVAQQKRIAQEAADQKSLADETGRKIEELQLRQTQLVAQLARLEVRSPVDGVVTELAVAHPGRVLDTSRPAATIMPGAVELVAKIEVPNDGMRQLLTGLTARIQVDAYPVEDFGYLIGTVDRVEPDAAENGCYQAWVTQLRHEFPGTWQAEALRPGLQLETRVTVANHSVLSYLLKPLRRAAGPWTVGRGARTTS